MTPRRAPRCAVLVAAGLVFSVGVVPTATGASPPAPAPAPAPGSAASGGAAPAQAAAPAPKSRVVTLAGQTAFARPDESLQLTFDLAAPADELELAVVVHRAVTSRTEFTQNLAGRALGGVEGRLSAPVADLPTTETGQRRLTLGVQGPAPAAALPDPMRIVPGRSGIYPTEIQLLRDGTVVDRFVTPLVVVAGGLSPLTMAWVWRFDATPAHQPDGSLRPSASRAMSPSGRLVRTAQAAAAADVHLTLAPTPETLTAWSALSQQEEHQPGGPPADGAVAGLTALKTAGNRGHQLLRGPFVPVDIAGLLEADLAGEIDAEFGRGADDQQRILGGLAPAPYTMLVPGPIDAAGLGRLRQYGADRLVFPPDALQPRDQRLTPGRPFAVGAKGQAPHPAAVTDPDLAKLLEGDEPPALRAARFLAGLSLVALEAPGESRGVVVVSPDEWDPPAPLLEAVLRGLKDNPAVVPATLDEYFAAVSPEQNGGRTVLRDLATGRGADPGDADTLQGLRRQLAAFAGVVEPSSDWLETADRTILLSRATVLQSDARGDRKSAADYLRGADKLFKGITSKVRGPKDQRVTLTSRRATIPISLFNATGRPLQVRVRLESDQLRFLDGAERFVTLASQNTTERFRVESRSTGAFPLEITVTSPDGLLRINSSELTIRSTVVSGVGAVLTAGAGLFLMVWWGNDLRRSRRRRNGRARRQERIAAKAAARALDDAERVTAKTG